MYNGEFAYIIDLIIFFYCPIFCRPFEFSALSSPVQEKLPSGSTLSAQPQVAATSAFSPAFPDIDAANQIDIIPPDAEDSCGYVCSFLYLRK